MNHWDHLFVHYNDYQDKLDQRNFILILYFISPVQGSQYFSEQFHRLKTKNILQKHLEGFFILHFLAPRHLLLLGVWVSLRIHLILLHIYFQAHPKLISEHLSKKDYPFFFNLECLIFPYVLVYLIIFRFAWKFSSSLPLVTLLYFTIIQFIKFWLQVRYFLHQTYLPI